MNIPGYILYVFVKDFPSMNPGKAAAHSGHAVSKFLYDNFDDNQVQKWLGDRGFGTQINLKWPEHCNTHHELLGDLRGKPHYIKGYVEDPTYPFIVDNDEIFNLIDKTKLTGIPTFLDNGKILCCRSEVTAVYCFINEVDNHYYRDYQLA